MIVYLIRGCNNNWPKIKNKFAPYSPKTSPKRSAPRSILKTFLFRWRELAKNTGTSNIFCLNNIIAAMDLRGEKLVSNARWWRETRSCSVRSSILSRVED